MTIAPVTSSAASSINALIARSGVTPTPRQERTEQTSRPERALAPNEQRNEDGDVFAPSDPNRASAPNGEPLSEEEQRQVEELKARDQEVRTHEQAHVAAAGSLFRGGPFYSYQTGPDGKRYAVGGSVNIDTSPVDGDPQATIQKAQQIRRAALAPAEPSSTDQQVASKASQMEAEARAELAEQQRAEQAGDVDEPERDGSSNRLGMLVDAFG
ncbi:MAG: putative metalloprotease CJM1_0395 family protein [Planctomycetota bacterium]